MAHRIRLHIPPGYRWDPSRGHYLEYDTDGMRVVRTWPRPAAWIYIRRLKKWRAFTPRVWDEAWASDDPPMVEVVPPTLAHALAIYRDLFGSIDPTGEGFDMDLIRDPFCDDTPERVTQRNAERAAAYAAWRAVPVEVREAAQRIAPQDLWRAVRLMGHVPELLTLAGTVPWFAHALAYQERFRKVGVQRPYRAIRRLLRLPDGMARWRAIAGWLGFEASAAFVNVVRKASAHQTWDFDVSGAAIREIWASPDARKRLLHARRIDSEVFRLVHVALETRNVRRLHPDLVDAAWAGGGYSGVARYFGQVAAAWQLLEPNRPLPCFRSAEELEAARESLIRRVHAHAAGGEFPPPPLPDTPHVVALRDDTALSREGAEMRHCMGNGTWSAQARRLEGYGYAVRVGEDRGSVWISRASRGYRFVLNQLRGPGNAPAAERVVRAVQAWLSEHALAVEERGAAALDPVWQQACVLTDALPLPPALAALMEDDIPF